MEEEEGVRQRLGGGEGRRLNRGRWSKVNKRRQSSSSTKQKKSRRSVNIVMELIRAAVILSVMTSLCQGQRTVEDQPPLDNVAPGDLVSGLFVIHA